MKFGDLIWLVVLACVFVLLGLPATHGAFVTATALHPYLVGFAKFFVLATMGELLARRIAGGRWTRPPGLFARAVTWGLLGMAIVLVFDVFAAGVASALKKGMLPGGDSRLAFAFFVSTIMNLTFAPAMMLFHRVSDTFIDMRHARAGASVGLDEVVAAIDWSGFVSFVLVKTIPLFWIPAHTVTFLLPPEYRVLAAALLSIALGAILASAKRRPRPSGTRGRETHAGTDGAAGVADNAKAPPGDTAAGVDADIDAAFWIILARAPNPREREDWSRTLRAGQERAQMVRALMGSPDFALLYDAYTSRGARTERKLDAVEQGLRSLGGDARFLEVAYVHLLGREGDAGGVNYYQQRLDEGTSRYRILESLVLSDEFAHRYQEACPQVGLVPHDIQLCELANPAKWDNPAWISILRSLGTLPPDKPSMHRKAYEYTQALFGLTRLGRLVPDARVVSVGAGHECLLYWLANRVRQVVATDMYDTSWGGAWASEGDDRVIRRPEAFAPFDYRQDHLTFMKMDGRHLAFASGTFDVAYSLSSIEHFGGVEGASLAVDEMARVLKPGGLLVLATEYILSGPPHHEAFQPEEVRALAGRAGLRLVEPIDELVHRRYAVAAVDIRQNPFQTPHMAVRDGETVFTSVMMFLEKP